MQHSGANNPCPLCGRTKGDYCRWDDDRIFCYRGQSCGPPTDLKIGQTLEIDGETWALVKENAGFAGNSCMFVLHDPSTAPRQLAPSEQLRQTAQLMEVRDQFEQDAELAFTGLNHVRSLGLFHDMLPAQIREALTTCQHISVLFKDLLVRCRRLRRISPDIGAVADVIGDGRRGYSLDTGSIQMEEKPSWQVWLLPAAIAFLGASVFTGAGLVATALREAAQQPVVVERENRGAHSLDVRLHGLPFP